MDILRDITDGIANTGRNAIKGLPAPVQNFITGDNSQSRRQPRLLPEFTLFVDCNERNLHFRGALPESFQWSNSAEYDTPFRDLINETASKYTVGRIAGGVMKAHGIQMVTQALTAKFWSGSASQALSFNVTLQARSDEVKDVLQPLLDMMSLTMPSLQGGNRGSVLRSPGPHFDVARAYQSGKAALSNSSTLNVAGSNTAQTPNSQPGNPFGKLVAAGGDAINKAFEGNWTEALDSTSQAVQTGVSGIDSFLRSNTRNLTSLQIGRYIRLPSVVVKDVQHNHMIQPVSKGLGKSSGNMQRVELAITFEPFTELVLDDLQEIFLDPRVRDYAKSLIDTNFYSE